MSSGSAGELRRRREEEGMQKGKARERAIAAKPRGPDTRQRRGRHRRSERAALLRRWRASCTRLNTCRCHPDSKQEVPCSMCCIVFLSRTGGVLFALCFHWFIHDCLFLACFIPLLKFDLEVTLWSCLYLFPSSVLHACTTSCQK